MDYSLSDSDLKTLIPGVNIVVYNDIAKYRTIDDVLQGKPTVILFEMNEQNRGHWCCLFKQGNTIYFFDSYGIFIEEQKKYMSKSFLRRANYLSKLIKDSPYKVDINFNKYQKMDSSINTCGRHVAVRLNCMDLNDKQYKKAIMEECKNSDMNPDELVVDLTMPIINN